MKSGDRHKWEKVNKEDDKCTYCGCIRSSHVYLGRVSYVYTRGSQVYEYRPNCYGKVPINEQGID